jgi:hypothetical protein
LKIVSSFFKLLSIKSNVCCKVKSIFPENMYQLSKFLKVIC